MKLFDYLKLILTFSIVVFIISCSDNENLDEIIEPELELMSRENAFTEDGIIVKDDSDDGDNNNTNNELKFIIVSCPKKFINNKFFDFNIPINELEECLGDRFIFIKKLQHNKRLDIVQETWLIQLKEQNNIEKTVGVGNELDPNKPNPLICRDMHYEYISINEL